MRFSSFLAGLTAVCSTGLMASATWAQEAVTGKPVNGATGWQPGVTEMALDIEWLDAMLLYICVAIVVFVTALLIIVAIRFNAKRNPVPATFTHNSPLEIVWTLIPILILVFIGAFSLPILFKSQEIPTADLTIKATGHQWYWSYEYPDQEFGFDTFLVDGSTKVDSLGDDQPMGTPQINDDIAQMKLKALGYASDEFLLATDNAVVIPVNKVIVVQVTGADVIHGWVVPALGVQQSGVPGRLAELWFKAEKEGTYFGQCSSLCGQSHAYMPITVKVVSQAEYDAWLVTAKAQFASTAPTETVKVAANN